MAWRRRFSYWRPYVSVGARCDSAEREIEKLRKKGEPVSPVRIDGRTIATTFWGKAWCDNLEGYSDFSNRLPRGRSYLSNGLVIDLQVERGLVRARVMGSDLYRVEVRIDPMKPARWKALVRACAGQVDSMLELLQGRISGAVMQKVTQPREGLFPSPSEIHLKCSCPDWASMCKHVAASLYGVGARLDHAPELLFTLRGVQASDLVVDRGAARAITRQAEGKALRADAAELEQMFGIEMQQPEAAAKPAGAPKRAAKPAASGGKPARTRRKNNGLTVTQAELDSRRISKAIVRHWLAGKLLKPSQDDGVFEATAEVLERIALFEVRGPKARAAGPQRD
jgi:uncharacterized Zn finger protein